jgi:hypothetical protein
VYVCLCELYVCLYERVTLYNLFARNGRKSAEEMKGRRILRRRMNKYNKKKTSDLWNYVKNVVVVFLLFLHCREENFSRSFFSFLNTLIDFHKL